MMTTSSCSNVNVGPQVFINFRGEELRYTFVSHLHEELNRNGINAFLDSNMVPGEKLVNLFQIIEESTIALAILSSRYTESKWCLDELVKMKECSTKGEGCKNLLVIPIFYKLDISVVKALEGTFGVNLLNLWREPGSVRDDRIVKWNAALQDVLSRAALIFDGSGEEKTFVAKIVTKVKNALTVILLQSQEKAKSQEGRVEEIPYPPKFHNRASSSTEPREQRRKQLEEKLDVDCNDDETRILGLVGMAGIGKTYLANELLVKLKTKIGRDLFIDFGCEKSKELESDWLQKTLVERLSEKYDPNLVLSDGNSLEDLKNFLMEKKVAVVFDNVIDKKQIEPLMWNCDWIKKGSRIVITTRDKSLTEGLVSDLYEVPGLNEREGLELFRAQIGTTLDANFMELSRKFVEFTGGNPLALNEFGKELHGKDKDQWEARLRTFTHVSNEEIGKVLRTCFEGLNERQKDAFLDIANFFRSHDENYVRSLLESPDPESAEAGNEFSELIDKFLIALSDGRVQINDLLFTMAKELVETSGGKYLLFPSNFAGSIDALKEKEGKDKVRGLILDMSNMEEKPLDNQAFVDMKSLRYLKVYYSLCPAHSEARCKLNLPDGIKFPKYNIVRYLDWMKFPGKELPSAFEPKYLIDLRLPYSKITCLWNCAKVTPKLKWVDLSHSTELTSISSLSDAPNLLRLNLEGCTSLEELPKEMEKMKNLVFLNLRGCQSLLSMPNITMYSLKTLILSDCSKLRTFEVISENLETLYLNGTAIDGLPPAIGNLYRLKFLNLKDCKNLATLPDFLGKLKALQELKLTGCSKLEIFPDVKEIMENLRVLLLDGTSITKTPSSIIDLSSLRRLCLSNNDQIFSLEFDVGQMFYLKWLELKHCKKLTSLPRLPPNLQCLNAHGCTSLRTVASPLALLMPTEQIHSTFILTNCHELEQVSKNAIISYVQKKSELMSDDRYNQDFVFKSLISTCFPGCDIPAWFNYHALGSVLKLELPQDWNAGRFIGIALSVVVSFKEFKHQNNGLQVKCTCEFANASLSPESFIVGGWSEPGDEPHTVASEHVFIAYTTLFNIKKRQKFSSANEVSLRFEVTNGTSAVAECEVMKSGFSLVYEPEIAENTSWETSLRMEQRSSYTEDDDECPSASPNTADYKRLNSFPQFFLENRNNLPNLYGG